MEKTKTYQQEFKEEGVVYPIQLFSHEETFRYQQEFSLMENAFGGKLPYAGNTHYALDWAYDLTTNPQLLKYVTSILGEDICVVGSLMLTKYPKSTSYVSWHQDGMNSGWDQNNSLTVWLAFTESNIENGCMQVIPKSHKNLLQDHVYFTDDENMIRKGHKIAAEVNEEDALNLELRPGEFSMHHNSIIHGSRANTSHKKRIGFIIRYVSTEFVNSGTSVVYAHGRRKNEHVVALNKPDVFERKYDPEIYKTYLTNNIVIK
jgi:ectoine hydroxylase-related dioxygenase (phytanoyl-CoA dioxygenase family)